MIYGIVASEAEHSIGGGVDVAKAVHFSGTSGQNFQCGIKLNSLSCIDNGYSAWAGWFKTNWYPSSGFPVAWLVDPQGDYIPYFFRNGTSQWDWNIGNHTASMAPTIGASNSLDFLFNDTWTHIIAACDVNQSAGNKKIKIYVNDVDATANISDFGAAWTFIMNGKEFWLGDSGYGDSFEGDIADFSFWPGVNLLTVGDISEATRRLFIDAIGKPVAPSVAIASLGTPAIMCTGNADDFLANSLGSNGSLSVPAGYDPIISADSSPYD